MERKDLNKSSELKRFIYERLSYLEGARSTTEPDLKAIESEETCLKKIIEICDKRGRY